MTDSSRATIRGEVMSRGWHERSAIGLRRRLLLPGKHYEDWELDAPAAKTLEQVRPIRDEIRDRVIGLLNRLDGPLPPNRPVAGASGASLDAALQAEPEQGQSPAATAADPDRACADQPEPGLDGDRHGPS